MQDKIIIFIPAQAERSLSWVVLDDQGKIKQVSDQANSMGLTQAAYNKKIIVIVPAEDVLLLIVALPSMSRSRLQEALPFAIEDQLIADVETLHFAIGARQADGQLPVAIVAKAKMAEWIALLQSSNIQADVLLPATFALPLQDQIWTMMIGETVVARTGPYAGFACDRVNLTPLLTAAIAAAPAMPERIQLYHDQGSTVFLSVNAAITIQDERADEAKCREILAQHVTQTPFINLLQGTYRTKKSNFSNMQKLGKVAIYLVVAWLSFLFLYPAISYFILAGQARDMEAQMQQIVKRYYPHSNSSASPRRQMEAKLKQLSANANDDKLFTLLGYIGQAEFKTPTIKLKRLDFQNQQLTVEFNAASSDDFSAFTDFLTQQGLKVKQQNAELVGTRLNATIILE